MKPPRVKRVDPQNQFGAGNSAGLCSRACSRRICPSWTDRPGAISAHTAWPVHFLRVECHDRFPHKVSARRPRGKVATPRAPLRRRFGREALQAFSRTRAAASGDRGSNRAARCLAAGYRRTIDGGWHCLSRETVMSRQRSVEGLACLPVARKVSGDSVGPPPDPS